MTTRGRPTSYSSMIAQCIRDRVLSGEPMTRVCEALGIGRTTVHRWEREHAEFRDMIRPTVAVEEQCPPALEPPEDAAESVPPPPYRPPPADAPAEPLPHELEPAEALIQRVFFVDKKEPDRAPAPEFLQSLKATEESSAPDREAAPAPRHVPDAAE